MRGLFNDPAAQIGELSPTIRANIKTMEGQLQSFAAALGKYSFGVSLRKPPP
jgi:hypothetical protein